MQPFRRRTEIGQVQFPLVWKYCTPRRALRALSGDLQKMYGAVDGEEEDSQDESENQEEGIVTQA